MEEMVLHLLNGRESESNNPQSKRRRRLKNSIFDDDDWKQIIYSLLNLHSFR